MEISNMKNMVILKKLPSNIVDEAFIILKKNIKLKDLEHVENKILKSSDIQEKNTKGYILKEAEMLVCSYADKLKKTEKNENQNKVLIKKYNRLKICNLVISVSLFVSLVINFI